MAKSDLDQDLASLPECGICLEEYKDPRALPCVHSFCLRCLKQHISATKDTDGSFHCPNCRDKFTPPEGDVEKIPKNFFLNSLKDAATLTLKHLEGPVVPTQCEPHNNNPDWYCQTCDLPGCAECMLQDHRLHETVKVTTIASNMEPDLLALSKLAAKRLATLQNISSDLESRDIQMETEEAQLCREITETADAMRTLITDYEKKLVNKVKEARETFKNQAANARKECDVLKERYLQPEHVCREAESGEVSTAHCSACTYCQARDATAARHRCSVRPVEDEQNQCETLGDISGKCCRRS